MKNLDRAVGLVFLRTGCDADALRWVRYEIGGVLDDEFHRGVSWGFGIMGVSIFVVFAVLFFLRSSP